MGIARRVAELYEAKVNALLDRAEDPREMLDYSYAQQQVFLRRMRGAVADVAASRKLAGRQQTEARRTADRLAAQAEQAVAADQDDLGRDALRLRAEALAHADDLAAAEARLRAEEGQLAEAAQRLEARVGAFRYRKEALKAAYTAAEVAAAEGSIDRFWDANDVAEACRRAEDQTAALRARAEALGDQIGSAVSEASRPLDAGRIHERLDAISRQVEVEEELARIKEQIASPRRSGLSGASDAEGSQRPGRR
jgi:phage shock protein A